MSDDELLDELERERGFAARLGYLIFAQPMEKAAARIREQRDLLEECERVIDAMRQEIQNLGGSLEGIITADETLARLRAQERG